MPRLRPSLLAIVLLSTMTAISGGEAGRYGVHPPPEFAFTHSILGEHPTLEVFFDLYGETLASPGPESLYGLALANLTLGLVAEDPGRIVLARALFAAQVRLSQGREAETARIAEAYATRILTGKHPDLTPTQDQPQPPVIEKLPPPKDFTTIILGRSAIRVDKTTRIKTQVDRVTRDWLTGVNIKGSPGILDRASLVPFHEGEKAAELIDLTGATVTPVWGTRMRRFGEQWFAPDPQGIYRYEISEDKILNYPTSLPIDDREVLVNDTHGISGIAWACADADLAMGCGDHLGKVLAAYDLAGRGVNVYMPTDRFLGLLIGCRSQGIIIGSAPIRRSEGGAVIGDQPVAIAVDEVIVVSASQGHYPLQYYDTPRRYFAELGAWCNRPLRLIPVEVKDYGKGMPVVARARTEKAKVIGMRVKSVDEHDAVAAWLKEDASHRAILFHSAVYPDGYRLFQEFPTQTSFGDVRPEFR